MGPIGGAVTLKGTWFDPNEAGSIELLFESVNLYGPVVSLSCTGGLSINAAGTFVCKGALPVAATPGEYTVVAYDPLIPGDAAYAPQFTVETPQMSITKPGSLKGEPGSSFTAKGTWFDPNDAAAITFSLEGPGVSLTVTCSSPLSLNAEGNFACTFTIPTTAAPGIYTLQASDPNIPMVVTSSNALTVT